MTQVGISVLTYELILLLSFPGCEDEAEAEAGCESQSRSSEVWSPESPGQA